MRWPAGRRMRSADRRARCARIRSVPVISPLPPLAEGSMIQRHQFANPERRSGRGAFRLGHCAPPTCACRKPSPLPPVLRLVKPLAPSSWRAFRGARPVALSDGAGPPAAAGQRGHLPGVSPLARPAYYSGSLSAQRFCYQFSQGALQRSRGATPSLGGSTFAVGDIAKS